MGENNSISDLSRRGVEHADVIDMIFHDKEKDQAVLVMVEPREWDGSDAHLFQLQEKFNAYMSFALDGELTETYPALANKALRLQLESVHMPHPRALEMLQRIHDQVAFQGVVLEVRVKEKPDAGCGAGCGCT
jgi:hypothetical protein